MYIYVYVYDYILDIIKHNIIVYFLKIVITCFNYVKKKLKNQQKCYLLGIFNK